ncbi:hypothetical protein [Roseomonas sp. USHLN139]|uniref:hypothetical protein n=1 Tax=Roseomonas sp. USHLN139 TaxID=3081298 RepID=UPI003B01296D
MYPMMAGRPGDWRFGVAAAYLRHLRWLTPETDVPPAWKEVCIGILNSLNDTLSAIPEFDGRQHGAVYLLAAALHVDDAERIAAAIMELRDAALTDVSNVGDC